MPNFDRKGPEGKGPTGRRLGGCRFSQEITNDNDNSASSGGGRWMRGRSDAGRRCRGLGGGRGRQCGQK